MDREILGFSIFFVGHTPRPISMQNFKSPPVPEVPSNYDLPACLSVSEANASIIY